MKQKTRWLIVLKSAKHLNRFVLLFLLHFIFISELLSFVINYFEIETDAFSFQLFGYPMAVLPPVVLYFVITEQKPKNVLHLMPLGVVNSVLILIMAVTFQPVLMLITSFTSLIFPNESSSFVTSFLHIPLWALVLCLAVMPAILEELVFRGICLNNNLKVSFRNKALLSAFFFAIIHLSPQQFPYAFAAGFYLAVITYITRSVLAPMLTHFTWNAANIWIIYSAGNTAQSGTAATQTSIVEFVLSAAFVLVVTFPLFLFAFYLLILNNLNKIVFELFSSRFSRIAELYKNFKPAYAAPDADTSKTINKEINPETDVPKAKIQKPLITWEFYAICAVYIMYIAVRYFMTEASSL